MPMPRTHTHAHSPLPLSLLQLHNLLQVMLAQQRTITQLVEAVNASHRRAAAVIARIRGGARGSPVRELHVQQEALQAQLLQDRWVFGEQWHWLQQVECMGASALIGAAGRMCISKPLAILRGTWCGAA